MAIIDGIRVEIMSDRKTKSATMVDVANDAGVSLKTVSRVLNKEEYVSEAARDVVLASASKLGYKLNQAARTLRSGTAQILAILVDNPSRSYLENIHFGALKKCQQLSMQLILDECPNGVDDIKRLMHNISPAAYIVTPPLCDDPKVIKFLDDNECTYVLISPDDLKSAPLSVRMDDEKAALEITEYLINLGHERIGFIKGHPEHSASTKRLNGYNKAHDIHNLDIDSNLITQGYFDYASGLICAEELLNLEHRPTAIFASNDDMAAAVIAAAYKRNITITRDLSVVGFDDTPIASIISPQLTTIRQPISELAAKAVELLSENINHSYSNQSNDNFITLDYSLIERDTVDKWGE